MKTDDLIGLSLLLGLIWGISSGTRLSGLGAVCPNCGLGSCPTQTANQTMAKSGCAAPAIASAHTSAEAILKVTGGPQIPPMSVCQPPIFMDIPSVPPIAGAVQAKQIMRKQARSVIAKSIPKTAAPQVSPLGVSTATQVAIFTAQGASPVAKAEVGERSPAPAALTPITKPVVGERSATLTLDYGYTAASSPERQALFEDIT